TGIMGNAGLALDLLPAHDPIAGMLDDVMRASERAAAVSRQLLAFSGKTGRFVAHLVDLSEVIEDLSGLAQASISKKVQLKLELDRSIPLIEADTTQIRQVVLNLIANGAESLGDASGTVKVKVRSEVLSPAAERHFVGSELVGPGSYV